MPNGKLIAWIVGISLVTTIALERYKANGAPKPRVVRA